MDPAQQEKGKEFYDLHHSGKLLILPNIWDSIGALLLEDLGYPAVATASAAIAFSNGYDDGEKIPFDVVLTQLKRIVSSVAIPVTADVESGYADSNGQLEENIKRLLETGIVGINFEDTDKKTSSIVPLEKQCEKIQLIKKAAKETGLPLFINARTDIYVRGKGFDTSESKFDETIRRGIAYKSAGADCFFPLAMRHSNEIKKAVEILQMPLNIVVMQGVPELNTLQEMGVARVSLGPGFLKIAIKSMKQLAVRLQHYDSLSDIIGNEITSDYLKGLVTKK